jgi:anti-sigma factor RsiW
MHPNELTLNEYADEALTGAERANVERHVEQCSACRSVVDDLRAIASAARTLTPIAPPPSAWGRIAERIQESEAERPASSTSSAGAASGYHLRRWGWFAAAAVLVLAAVVGLRVGPLAPHSAPPASALAATPSTSVDAQSVESELRQAEAHYDKAIKGLEQITSAGQGALDPKTAATLQKNLSVIDQAISESRAAVHSQPNSEPAQASLLDNFKMKIGLLQDTVSLINEMRKGNDAGAARIVSGLKEKGE